MDGRANPSCFGHSGTRITTDREQLDRRLVQVVLKRRDEGAVGTNRPFRYLRLGVRYRARLLGSKDRGIDLLEAVHCAAGTAVRPNGMDATAASVNPLVVAVLIAQIRARDGLVRRR